MEVRRKELKPGGPSSGEQAPAPIPTPNDKQDKKRRSSDASSASFSSPAAMTATTTASSWWFASTAIPLLAATTGPLSNVLSIAALVTSWRVSLPDNGQLPLGIDDNGVGIADPHWEISLNALSLACGFTGNFFLLLNFTGRVRYIVALPLSIIFWVLASSILIAIFAAMHVHDPPIGPGEIYSQGFWHAVLASILYFLGSLMLVVNMLGYVRGHYPQQFDLDDDQRTLILQTMMFFFWLAAGAGIYTRLEGWSYSNALYFADVSVLTVGFGDIAPATNAGRGFLFVFELIGITSLGLVISSISRFVRDISANKIVKSHQLHTHKSTLGRTVTNEKELRDRLGLPPRFMPAPVAVAVVDPGGGESTGVFPTKKPVSDVKPASLGDGDGSGRASDIAASAVTATAGQERRPNHLRANTQATASLAQPQQDPDNVYGHIEIIGNTVTYHEHTATVIVGGRGGAARRVAINRDDPDDMDGQPTRWRRRHRRRQQQRKLLLLREEKDRYDAMREIQEETRRFKQYYALAMALLAFGLLWGMGAVVFMFSEKRLQNLSYFDALYFGFVALLTIGYGDISPKSNAGKAFFIVWSLIAVPTMTILIQEMSETVVTTLNRGTFKLADWTVLPKKGLATNFVANVRMWLTRLVEGHQARLYQRNLGQQRRRQPSQAETGATEAGKGGRAFSGTAATGVQFASEEKSEHHLARQLAAAIRDVAHDLGAEPPKRYSYEQWAHFAELIRFSRSRENEEDEDEADGSQEGGLVEWDWIGEDSPMLADTSEAQWALDRLCESLNRYTRQQARRQMNGEKKRPASEKAGCSVPSPASTELACLQSGG